jgi:hypothetical protein
LEKGKSLLARGKENIIVDAYSYAVDDGAVRPDIHIDYEHFALAF